MISNQHRKNGIHIYFRVTRQNNHYLKLTKLATFVPFDHIYIYTHDLAPTRSMLKRESKSHGDRGRIKNLG